jgi:hypothetical protein
MKAAANKAIKTKRRHQRPLMPAEELGPFAYALNRFSAVVANVGCYSTEVRNG